MKITGTFLIPVLDMLLYVTTKNFQTRLIYTTEYRYRCCIMLVLLYLLKKSCHALSRKRTPLQIKLFTFHAFSSVRPYFISNFSTLKVDCNTDTPFPCLRDTWLKLIRRFPLEGNLVLNYADLVDFYTARGLHHFAALLHAKFLRMEAACAVWSQLVQQHQLTMDTQFPGLAYFCQRLADLRDDEEEELLWAHADTCLER